LHSNQNLEAKNNKKLFMQLYLFKQNAEGIKRKAMIVACFKLSELSVRRSFIFAA
jgi:hypothetical protein